MERSDLAGHFATMNDMAQKPQYEPTDQQARYGGKLETKGSCVEVPPPALRTECYRLGKQCRERLSDRQDCGPSPSAEKFSRKRQQEQLVSVQFLEALGPAFSPSGAITAVRTRPDGTGRTDIGGVACQ